MAEHCPYCAGYGCHKYRADSGWIYCAMCGGKITRTKDEFVGPERRMQYKECDKLWEAKEKVDAAAKAPRRRAPIAQVPAAAQPARRRAPIGKVGG